jgi:hypothetical protein
VFTAVSLISIEGANLPLLCGYNKPGGGWIVAYFGLCLKITLSLGIKVKESNGQKVKQDTTFLIN